MMNLRTIKLLALLLLALFLTFNCLSLSHAGLKDNKTNDTKAQGDRLDSLRTRIDKVEELLNRVDENQKRLETAVTKIDKSVKRFEETEQLYLVFSNYRVDLVGIIIAAMGVTIVVIGLYTYKKGIDNLNAIKENKRKAEEVLTEILKKKEAMDLSVKDTEKEIINVIDWLVYRISKLAEVKATTVDLLKGKIRGGIENEVFQLFVEIEELEKESFDKISYAVNLFHIDEKIVENSILYFRKKGRPEDITELNALLKRDVSEVIKSKARAAIREIKARG